MNKTTKIILICVCCLSFLFSCVQITQAQVTPSTRTQLETPTGPGTSKDQPLVKCGNTGEKPCTVDDANKLIQDILNLIFMFASFIVAGMFMYAGFMLITATGDMGKIQQAKDIFRRVVIGFLIMFLSYIIVKNLVENLVGESKFKSLFMGLFK